jgi:DNA-directed RNA polymerase subunit K/omega
MGFIPVEKVTNLVENKYEAVLIAAREARVQNSISQLEDRDPNAIYPKVTTVALTCLIDNKVRYYYGDEAPPPVEAEDDVLDIDDSDD